MCAGAFVCGPLDNACVWLFVCVLSFSTVPIPSACVLDSFLFFTSSHRVNLTLGFDHLYTAQWIALPVIGSSAFSDFIVSLQTVQKGRSSSFLSVRRWCSASKRSVGHFSFYNRLKSEEKENNHLLVSQSTILFCLFIVSKIKVVKCPIKIWETRDHSVRKSILSLQRFDYFDQHFLLQYCFFIIDL